MALSKDVLSSVNMLLVPTVFTVKNPILISRVFGCGEELRFQDCCKNILHGNSALAKNWIPTTRLTDNSSQNTGSAWRRCKYCWWLKIKKIQIY